MSYQIREYVDAGGSSPFRVWLNSLDRAIRARVQARILRFEGGNLGDCKWIGKGVMEARLAFGPGYRVYFGIDKKTLVILLTGGDKRSQAKDIQSAQWYWADYLEANRNG